MGKCCCESPKSLEQQIVDLETKLNNLTSLVNALNEHVYSQEHKHHRGRAHLETLEIKLGNE